MVIEDVSKVREIRTCISRSYAMRAGSNPSFRLQDDNELRWRPRWIKDLSVLFTGHCDDVLLKYQDMIQVQVSFGNEPGEGRFGSRSPSNICISAVFSCQAQP